MQKYISYILILFSSLVLAQAPLTYTTKDGLPSNLVYDMVEDSNGFMWFATKRGVAKFDGKEFRTFTSKNGLPNNDTWRLEADTLGAVYFASKSKYQGYIKNDSVHTFKTANNKVLSPSLFKTDAGMIWVADGIYTARENKLTNNVAYDKLSKKIINKFFPGEKNLISTTLPIEKNLIILFTKNSIHKLDSNLQDLKEPIYLEALNQFNTVVRYSTSSVGFRNTLLVVLKEGLLFYNYQDHNYIFKTFKELGTELPDEDEITRLSFLENEIQAKVGSIIYRFNYQYELTEIVELPSENNTGAYIDSFNNLWITSGKGIKLYTAASRNTNIHLPSQVVSHLGLIAGNIYAGSFKKGFARYENTGFRQIPKLKYTESIYNIDDLSPNPKSFLLGGTRIYAVDNFSSEPYEKIITDKENNKRPILYKDLIPTDTGNYYGISSGTIDHVNIELDSARSIILKQGLLQLEKIQDIFLAGGSDGLHEIRGDTLLKIAPENTITNTPVERLKTFNDTLYIGTNGSGLYRYSNNKIWPLTSTDGLSVQEILKEKDTLWLATNDGIKKILLPKDPTGKEHLLDQFYDADGLLENNINDIVKIDNTLFVATDLGVSEINVNHSIYQAPIAVYFKTTTDTISKIYSKTNDLTVQFGAIDYTNAKYLQFQYRLEPNQIDWTTTKTTSVNFSNLSPGTYTLQVKATNQHFIEGSKSLTITIEPLWWQTVIAKVVFALLGILGLGVFGLAVRNIIRRKEQDKNERDKRVAGLELQALRSQMNPHFVHNSLNAIQYYIQRNEVELSENYLSKFSKLIRMFFEYSRKETLSLREEIVLIKSYLEIEKMRFEDKLNYTITMDKDLELDEHLIPSMILQPILENSVNHGIFHKKSNGTIQVNIKTIQNGYKVHIEDDGIGINRAKEIYASSSRNYQSKSSAVLQERFDLLQQNNDWLITYKIQDLSEIGKQGTSVVITFQTPHS